MRNEETPHSAFRTPHSALRNPRLILSWLCLLVAAPIRADETPASSRLIIATDHESVLKLLGKAADPLPKTRFTLLSGSGLDRNIVIRQAVADGVQYSCVLNPAWWPVKVTIRLDCADEILSVKTIAQGKEYLAESTDKQKTLTLDLAPHEAAVVTVKPPASFLSAETQVSAEVRTEIAEPLTDLTMILPRLATRRPNLLAKNAGFESLDSRKLPTNWQVFDWHRKDSLFGADTTNVREGKQSFFMDGTVHGKTIGIVSDRIRVHPGCAYTFAVDLGSSAQPAEAGKARIGFTGSRHFTKEVAPDTIWREFSIDLPAEQSKTIAPTGVVRVEVHNDAKGILWVDNAKVVDSTVADLETSRKIELLCQRLAGSFSSGDMVDCFRLLQEPVLKDLLQKVAEMKKGREWLVVGPFPSASDGDLLKAYPPEKDVLEGKDLREKEYDGGGGLKVEWITSWTTEAKGAPGYMDLCAAVGPYDSSIAYAYARVRSDFNQKVRLLIGSDDGIAVWINGKPVHVKAGSRAANPGDDVVDAELKNGWNDILLKIRNGGSEWGFFFAIADENKQPLADIEYARRLIAGRTESK